ncbi:MAG: PASTA domain-containing protein [Cyclobacteriaceae bacterium]
MNWFKANSWIDLIKHLLIIVLVGVGAIFFFFYVYLPISTNHGETITVPDVVGISHDQLDQFLTMRNLRYEITEDSAYSADFPPLTVIKQFPLPNAKVKENRKVYISLNTTQPPLVRMPDLLEGSLINAQNVLKTYDLKVGKVEYVPDLFFNTVLKQKLDGREVLPDERIPKGSSIDLVLGDGKGNRNLASPRLIGLELNDAKTAIVGSALKVGSVKYETSNEAVYQIVNSNRTQTVKEQVAPGEVVRQNPEPGAPMKLQQMIDIWIYQPDSLNIGPSILDQ